MKDIIEDFTYVYEGTGAGTLLQSVTWWNRNCITRIRKKVKEKPYYLVLSFIL